MERELTVIPQYSKTDFLNSTEPFEWLYQFSDNKFRLQQMTELLKAKAAEVGVRNFTALFKSYIQSVTQNAVTTGSNVTEFENQELVLNCGGWYCDDLGVVEPNRFGLQTVACNHPIMPVQRLINIDTGIEKLKLAYKKGTDWRYIIADKKTLASNNAILQLSDYGVAVNSENARALVQYLADVEHLNYHTIPEQSSVGRLGWIDGRGFSPYVEGLAFDGDLSFQHFFSSVTQKGSFERWKELCSAVRQGSVYARICLAASFASVLVDPCDCLPFFVHLWGGTETGKTVALMLAASVWANPEMGKYIHTFNSTPVAQELSLGFVNSLPLIVDELQIIKDKKSFDDLIYTMTEGVGKGRGKKTGGLQRLETWRNCILTNGEFPLSNSGSGGGAINRIVEINCEEIKLFENPVFVAKTVKANYGHAGRLFVSKLQEEGNMEYARQLQGDFYHILSKGTATEKQAASASLILTADALLSEWIFHDEHCLTIEELAPFLTTKEAVNQNRRALEFLYDYVAINRGRFTVNEFGERIGEIWGDITPERICIIKSLFDKVMQENGFSPGAFLSWAKGQGHLIAESGRNTTNIRLGGTVLRCVCLHNERWSDD